MDILKTDTKMAKAFRDVKIRYVYEQGLSLKNILCPSKYLNPLKINNGFHPCGHPSCELCSMGISQNNISFENGKVFYIKGNFNCNSKFIIYVICCLHCDKKYIGECEALRARMNLHKSNTRVSDNRNLLVNKHIHQYSESKFKFAVLFQADENEIDRKCIENNFIFNYKPSLNP